MQNKIPKRFKLMGRTITVEFDDKLFTKEDKHGVAIFREGKIKLQPVSDGYTEETMHETFWHEFAHWLAYYAENADIKDGYLHQNEGFVNILAGLLHQATQTMEY